MRFGIRAKSIKNSARVNAELSPLELKGLLAKSQAANTSYQKYIAALEAEVAMWRAGGNVPESDWALPGKAGAAASAGAKATSPTPSASVPSSRSMTPAIPAIENLRADMVSRPQTPTAALEKDEREDFLRRENELSDILSERETALKTADKLVKELKDELTFLKEQEESVNKVWPSIYSNIIILLNHFSYGLGEQIHVESTE